MYYIVLPANESWAYLSNQPFSICEPTRTTQNGRKFKQIKLKQKNIKDPLLSLRKDRLQSIRTIFCIRYVTTKGILHRRAHYYKDISLKLAILQSFRN